MWRLAAFSLSWYAALGWMLYCYLHEVWARRTFYLDSRFLAGFISGALLVVSSGYFVFGGL